MGISGGLVEAYVLVGEITATPDDLDGALRRYDPTLRPLVDEIQAVVKPRLLAFGFPRRRIAVAALPAAFSVAWALPRYEQTRLNPRCNGVLQTASGSRSSIETSVRMNGSQSHRARRLDARCAPVDERRADQPHQAERNVESAEEVAVADCELDSSEGQENQPKKGEHHY
ncbi:hypothetical protein [Curtobacterium sp. Leaf261]|uniref:hypothetical protein n=1 Tax=Curtobacterium sp. Leaf261 TaxID=1736311 RepID=UPI0006FAD826|nr:hypothetical protein [Curtobacterium sp. Leaf261]KQO64312.1 hypothetical protein ASF23_17285 [Curtobacterium sp. Leaf261]